MNYLVGAKDTFKHLSLALMFFVFLCLIAYSNYSKAGNIAEFANVDSIGLEGVRDTRVTRDSSNADAWVWTRESKQNNELQNWVFSLHDVKTGAFNIHPKDSPGLCLDYEYGYNAYHAASKSWLKVKNCEVGRTQQQWITQKQWVTSHYSYVLRPVESISNCMSIHHGQFVGNPIAIDSCKRKSDTDKNDRWDILGDTGALEEWADLTGLWMKDKGMSQITSAVPQDTNEADTGTGSTGRAIPMINGVGTTMLYCQNETGADMAACWSGTYSNADMSSFTYGFGESATATIGTSATSPVAASFALTFSSNQSWTKQNTVTQSATSTLPVASRQYGWLSQGTLGKRYTARYKFTTDLGEEWISNVISATIDTPDSASGLTVCSNEFNYSPETACAQSWPGLVPRPAASAPASAPTENPFQ